MMIIALQGIAVANDNNEHPRITLPELDAIAPLTWHEKAKAKGRIPWRKWAQFHVIDGGNKNA